VNPVLDQSLQSLLAHCSSHTVFFSILELLLELQHSHEKLSFPANLEKNEAFLDQLFLHRKYSKFQDDHFNYLQELSELETANWKAYLEKIANSEKINFFTRLLLNEKISLNYFKIQTGRYQIKTLKKWCFFTLSKNLEVQPIDQLPLPKLLKEHLTEFVQSAQCIHQKLSPP
jgi:hypothetical protein